MTCLTFPSLYIIKHLFLAPCYNFHLKTGTTSCGNPENKESKAALAVHVNGAILRVKVPSVPQRRLVFISINGEGGVGHGGLWPRIKDSCSAVMSEEKSCLGDVLLHLSTKSKMVPCL